MKLDFDDFDLEESENCKYDSLTVFGDIDGKDEIGKVQKVDWKSIWYFKIETELYIRVQTFAVGKISNVFERSFDAFQGSIHLIKNTVKQ